MTEEGSLFQMGTVWQRKDDKWRDDEAEGKRKEWGKWVVRSCAQGTSTDRDFYRCCEDYRNGSRPRSGKDREAGLNDRWTKTTQNRSVELCNPVLDSMNFSPLLMGKLVLSPSWSYLKAQLRPRERNDFARATDWFYYFILLNVYV